MRGVPQHITTRLFREVDDILRTDDTLRKVVDVFKSYGERDASRAPATRTGVELRIFPIVAAQAWDSPDSHMLTLNIEAELALPVSDAGDYLDAWFAVVRALYPSNQVERLALHQRLRTAGAETGEATFTPPAPSRVEAGNAALFLLTGRISYRVRHALNV